MPKTVEQPLALKAVIPDKDNAIVFGGGEDDSMRAILDIYSKDLEDYRKFLEFRGQEFYIVLMTKEQYGQGQ